MIDPLKFGLSKSEIQKIQSIFKKYPEIEKVILYGSRALGTFKPASDIDLTMMTSNKDLSFLFKIENEIDELMLPYKVDLSIHSMLDNENLKEHIQLVGQEFYRPQFRKNY